MRICCRDSLHKGMLAHQLHQFAETSRLQTFDVVIPGEVGVTKNVNIRLQGSKALRKRL